MGLVSVAVVAGTSYVLGAKAGRERYEEIKAKAEEVWESEALVEGRARAKIAAKEAAKQAALFAATKTKDAAVASALYLKDATVEAIKGRKDSAPQIIDNPEPPRKVSGGK